MRVCSQSGCNRFAPKNMANPRHDTTVAITKLRVLHQRQVDDRMLFVQLPDQPGDEGHHGDDRLDHDGRRIEPVGILAGVQQRPAARPPRPAAAQKPVRSIGTTRVGVSRLFMLRQQSTLQTIPTGRLIRKIHGHEMLSEM